MSVKEYPWIHKDAILSEDRVYRYILIRRWSRGKSIMFIGLNPSTANESYDDPTIRRLIGFGKKFGFGGLVMCNLFAFRATKPKDMKTASDPIGPVNDKHIRAYAQSCSLVVACWGANEDFYCRGADIYWMIPKMKCFGMTKGGYPKHPLYLKKDTDLIDYNGE